MKHEEGNKREKRREKKWQKKRRRGRGGDRRHFSRPPGCATSLHGILRGCKISLSFFLRSMRWRNRDKANSSSQDVKHILVRFRLLWTIILITKRIFKIIDCYLHVTRLFTFVDKFFFCLYSWLFAYSSYAINFISFCLIIFIFNK